MPQIPLIPSPPAAPERLAELASSLRLPTIADELARRLLAAGHDDALAIVLDVFEMEAQDRRERRIERLRRASHLPPGKTFATLNLDRYPRPLVAKIRELARGGFIDRSDNILAFGLPGVGKSHVACAIGHALVEAGRSVFFTPTYKIVQELLAAKRDLGLPSTLRKLDAFDVVILDDIGYVKQNADEVEVLFTLMSDRYERRSLVITSNLLFSNWDQIFKNPMTTAAAIDRVVHHSAILEFPKSSFRAEEALKRAKGQAAEPANPPPEEPSPASPSPRA